MSENAGDGEMDQNAGFLGGRYIPLVEQDGFVIQLDRLKRDFVLRATGGDILKVSETYDPCERELSTRISGDYEVAALLLDIEYPALPRVVSVVVIDGTSARNAAGNNYYTLELYERNVELEVKAGSLARAYKDLENQWQSLLAEGKKLTKERLTELQEEQAKKKEVK